ncbi:MAG: PIG-L family deacetylase, partial [Comamonadaceae bacterium]
MAAVSTFAGATEVENDRAIEGLGTPEAEWLGWPGLAHLPALTVGELVPPGARAVVVAPHPDDEVLSVGGVLAMLAGNGSPAMVIAVTDGAASHTGSLEWPRSRLLRERPRETVRALAQLGMDGEPVRLHLPDGSVTASALAARLASLLRSGDVVFTTWRRDGHPDHDATGSACAEAADACSARLVEVP